MTADAILARLTRARSIQRCPAMTHDSTVAAPELLAALQDSWRLIAELEDAINRGLSLLPPDVERIAHVCAANRAAITKATA